MTKKYPMGNYGLSIVLAILFFACWGAQTYFGWKKFSAEEIQHGQSPKFAGDDGYVNAWMASTMENWQSEFLQLLSFVVLTAFLIHKGSHESRDEDDETSELLHRIEERIKRIEEAQKSDKAVITN